MQLGALAGEDAPNVEGEIDAAIAEGAEAKHRKEPGAASVSSEIRGISECEAQSGDNAPQGRSGVAVRGFEPAKKRRRSVRASHDGRAERKEEYPKQRSREQRVAVEDRAGRRQSQDRRGDQNETDEQRAVDRAFDETRAPVIPDGVEARRPPGKPVERDSRHQVHDRPQAALRERGAGAGKNDRQNRLRDELGGVGDERRRRGEDRARRVDHMRSPRKRGTIDADEADERQHGFAEEEKRERASNRNLRRKGESRMGRRDGADFGHVPIRGEGHEKIEQEGRRNETDRLNEAQPAIAADQRQKSSRRRRPREQSWRPEH